jgi:hypothetical protein
MHPCLQSAQRPHSMLMHACVRELSAGPEPRGGQRSFNLGLQATPPSARAEVRTAEVVAWASPAAMQVRPNGSRHAPGSAPGCGTSAQAPAPRQPIPGAMCNPVHTDAASARQVARWEAPPCCPAQRSDASGVSTPQERARSRQRRSQVNSPKVHPPSRLRRSSLAPELRSSGIPGCACEVATANSAKQCPCTGLLTAWRGRRAVWKGTR